MTNGEHRLPRRRADVELRDEGAQTLLFSRSTDSTHVLNPIARAIWELCDGSTTIEELVDAICQVFDVPRGTALSDVETVIDQLAADDLVRWSDGGPDREADRHP